MDASNAKRNQELGLSVLEQSLEAAGCLPKREFKNAAEFAEYLKNKKTLIFDGTEQRTQRSADNEAQKKIIPAKKGHTAIAVILSNSQRKVLYEKKVGGKAVLSATHSAHPFAWAASGDGGRRVLIGLMGD